MRLAQSKARCALREHDHVSQTSGRPRKKIAAGFEGVEKAYAVQAGRELRVFVQPEEVDERKRLTGLGPGHRKQD